MSYELPSIVEAIVFSSPEGIQTTELVRVVKEAATMLSEELIPDMPEITPPTRSELMRLTDVTESEILSAINQLIQRYEKEGHTYSITERAKGWRVFVRGAYIKWVRPVFPNRKAHRLSPPALETLAIIAYRQPVTKPDVEAIRGVNTDGVLQTLLDRQLVSIAGRSDLPGKPLLYQTTELFLDHFGINRVEDLPHSGELRTKALPGKETPSAESATSVKSEPSPLPS